MSIETSAESNKPNDRHQLSVSTLLPSISDYQSVFQTKALTSPEPAFIDFSKPIYGRDSADRSAPSDSTVAHLSSSETKAEKASAPDSDNFRSNFNTADEAAKAAFKEAYSSSQLQTAEYGARVYEDPITHKFGYTMPERYPSPGQPGYKDNLDPATHAPIPDAPPGKISIARLHTHVDVEDNGTEDGYQSLNPQPKSVSAKIVSGDPGDLFNKDPNRFSPMDLANAKNEHVSSYLAAPNGTMLRYDSKTGKVSPIGTVDK
jgi:hypothetical protein